VGDGHHRAKAALATGLTEIDAEVMPGTRRDALLYALSANRVHGLKRSNADKRHAVLLILADAEWRTWSDASSPIPRVWTQDGGVGEGGTGELPQFVSSRRR